MEFWLNVIKEICEIALLPLATAATAYLVACLKAKKSEVLAKTENETTKKYINMLDETITSCVYATNQTYVNTLKQEGSFDAESQKKAFKATYDAVMAILTEDAKKYLTESVSDLELYITNKIEAQVAFTKPIA